MSRFVESAVSGAANRHRRPEGGHPHRSESFWLSFAGFNSRQLSAAFALVALAAPVLLNTDSGAVSGAVPSASNPGIAQIRPAESSDDIARVVDKGPAPTTAELRRRGEYQVGAYLGSPYTYASDVRLVGPNDTDLTAKRVDWLGKPFDHPLYYGIRVARWSSSTPLGGMLDFTHSKVYSPLQDEIAFEGKVNGQALPPRAKISDVFRKLEFTHGHNMLIPTLLYRLPFQSNMFSSYVGAGIGVSLPHSEVQLAKMRGRTYEYQYVGPAAQVLAGIEIRVPTHSIFFEYKFTYANYNAPLSGKDGTWLPADLWRQFQRWWSGEPPPLGYASTDLISHQIIGGLAIRIKRAP